MPASSAPLSSWGQVAAFARTAGAKFPELVAAQWALESGWGKHSSGQNNVFGLKGGGSVVSTKEFLDGQWVEIKAGFIDFPSVAACIEYLVARWYKDWKGYKGVNNAPSRDAAARMLVSEGYATDPDYAAKLIRLMNDNAPAPAPPSPPAPPITLADAAKHDKGERHQTDAWQWLQDRLSAETLTEFARRYRTSSAPPPSPPTSAPQPASVLKVPYFSQRDNASGTGWRECFSSSCAMIAAFHGKVKGDDEYNAIRAPFGDSTSSTAQAQALASLGLKPEFRQNLVLADLRKEIEAGRPVAVGWLHHGNYQRPSGGGHWSVIVGITNDATIQHDPYGLCDLRNGGHTSAVGGNYAAYANRYWLPRWEVKGNDGWAMLVRP